jgi:hypothetical protein
VTPAAGKILWRGKPVAGAHLLLVPLSPEDKEAIRPQGITREDGTFKLTTYTPEDGAPAGEYAVSLTWKGPQRLAKDEDGGPLMAGGSSDYFKGRYRDPQKSGLRVKIEPGSSELSPINLK